jgi:hypothetical protein
MGLTVNGIVANNGLMRIGVITTVAACDIHHLGGAMLPWEAPAELVQARRRFGEDEEEGFGDYEFDEEEDVDEELDEDEDEDFDELEEEEDYDAFQEDFDDDDGEPRSPRRKKDWE